MEKICLSAVVRLCSDVPSPSLAGAALFSVVSVPVESPSEGVPGVVGSVDGFGVVGPPELSPSPLSSLPGVVVSPELSLPLLLLPLSGPVVSPE